MNDLGVFSRLVELIELGKEDESGLHKMMLELVYEMSRIQRLRVEELGKCCGQSSHDKKNLMKSLVLVGDESIMYLFALIEELSDDVNDSYHYPLIKVLVRLTPQQSDALILMTPIPSSFLTNNIWSRPTVATAMH